MAKIEFFIPIVPRGQSRAKHTSAGGFHRTYKTKDQLADERTLEALLVPFMPKSPLSGAVSLLITAVMPIPSSKPKKWQAAACDGYILPTVKPDLDNIAKNIIDCITRMRFIEDDKLICRLHLTKKYGECPGYLVILSQMEEPSNVQ